MIVEESERKLLEMIKHRAAQICLDVNPQHMAPVGDNKLKKRRQAIDAEQPNTCHHDQRPVIARQQLIDHLVHKHWKAQLQDCCDHGTREIEHEQFLVGL